ncbi:hypothetical protein BST61_g1471 [Cercospora zeina]
MWSRTEDQEITHKVLRTTDLSNRLACKGLRSVLTEWRRGPDNAFSATIAPAFKNGHSAAYVSSIEPTVVFSPTPPTMDTYGDTAVMHNDMQHNFYLSGFYAGGGLTPDMGFEYMPIPHWNTQWSINTSLQQQPWPTSGSNGLFSLPYQHPMTHHDVEPISRTLSVHHAQPELHVQSLATTTIPTTRQKRKLSHVSSDDAIDAKRVKVIHDSPTLSAGNSSPCSSSPSPSATLSTRAHYAVEKKYRSTLNERYATLARIVTQPETMEICRTEVPDWEVPIKLEVPEEGAERHPGKRQSKTTTLSVAIETMELLDRACARKAKELQELTRRLSAIAGSASGLCASH